MTMFDLRAKHGLTQKSVAAAAGMSVYKYCRIERGGDCMVSDAKAIADGLKGESVCAVISALLDTKSLPGKNNRITRNKTLA